MRYLIQSHSPAYRRLGVTLVEILVVIAIICVLATLSFFFFTSGKRFNDKLDKETQDAVAILKKNEQQGKKPGKNNNPVGYAPSGSTPVPAGNSSSGGSVVVPPFPDYLNQVYLTPNAPVAPAATPPAASVAAPPAVVTAPVRRPPSVRPDRIPGMYYVGFKPSVTDPNATAQRLANDVGGRVLDVYTKTIFGFGLKCSDDAKVALLRDDPAVELVEPARYIYPCAAPLNIQRMFSNGISGTQKTNAPFTGIYGVPTNIYRFSRNTSVKGIVTSRIYLPGSNAGSAVAILDTGIDNTHPDLNVVAAQDFTGTGNPQDLDGHGTHVAGVVGAADQTAGVGVVGVYPGAPLINLKVMGLPTKSPTGPITNVTGGGPFPSDRIVITSAGHGLTAGTQVAIDGVTDAPAFVPAVNSPPFRTITNVTTNTFELSGTGGGTAGTYTAGGAWHTNFGTITNVTGGGAGGNIRITDNAHGLKIGDTVTISGVPVADGFAPSANGTFVISAMTTNTFDLAGTGPGPNPGVYSFPAINPIWTCDTIVNDGLPIGSNLYVYSALSNYVIPNAKFIRVCLMGFVTNSIDPQMNALVDLAGNSGVLMVAAAGSTGAAINSVSPASAAQAIVVKAMQDSDGTPLVVLGDEVLAASNNTGAAAFAAPGGSSAPGYYLIQSTIPIAGQIANGLPNPYSDHMYGNPSIAFEATGTSFAAAHVAGILALVTDPQTSIGFVVGNRAVPTFAPQMTTRAGAIAGLTALTHQTASIQMISPLTGSAWKVSNTIPRIITPYRKLLFNDTMGGIPIPNLYQNPLTAPTNLPKFPG